VEHAQFRRGEAPLDDDDEIDGEDPFYFSAVVVPKFTTKSSLSQLVVRGDPEALEVTHDRVER
jgi:hypothetical protein